MAIDEAERAALAAATARVGDRWTLRVVHALLAGPKRFSELQAEVARIAPNVLAQRLKALEADGLVVAEPYQQRPPRFSYALTQRGQDLAGVLRLLAAWADETLLPAHAPCGTPLEVRWHCPHCEVVVDEADDHLLHL
jgi:DNA-binding HxlR family transcriptional regulator